MTMINLTLKIRNVTTINVTLKTRNVTNQKDDYSPDIVTTHLQLPGLKNKSWIHDDVIWTWVLGPGRVWGKRISKKDFSMWQNSMQRYIRKYSDISDILLLKHIQSVNIQSPLPSVIYITPLPQLWSSFISFKSWKYQKRRKASKILGMSKWSYLWSSAFIVLVYIFKRIHIKSQ